MLWIRLSEARPRTTASAVAVVGVHDRRPVAWATTPARWVVVHDRGSVAWAAARAGWVVVVDRVTPIVAVVVATAAVVAVVVIAMRVVSLIVTRSIARGARRRSV